MGPASEVEQVSSQGSQVADIILSYARDHGVDLIVIGAYTHARSVEMVFGGVNPDVAETGACSSPDVTVSDCVGRKLGILRTAIAFYKRLDWRSQCWSVHGLGPVSGSQRELNIHTSTTALAPEAVIHQC